MNCQHCDRRPATYQVSTTEASPEYVVCDECAHATSEFATLTPIEPQNIIQEIVDYLNTYMVFSNPVQPFVIALWVVHTYTFSQSFARSPWTTPYLYVNSRGPRSGKTLLIDLLEPIVLNPERGDSMTSAVMFRLIEAVRPCLFIDEVDTIWAGAKNEEMRGVINGGYKSSGYIWRTVPGPDGPEPTKFKTFCPKLLAGIDNGHLPDTIASRSIHVNLERVGTLDAEGNLMGPDGKVRDIYYSFMAEPIAEQLVHKILSFIESWAARWEMYVPKPIAGINPRQWEVAVPLIQVAAAVGIEQEAREALKFMFTQGAERDTPEVAILRQIQVLFNEHGTDKLHTATIAEHLNRTIGAGFNGKLLSSRLKDFHVGNTTTLTIGGKTAKAYYRHQFEEAWAAHL